MNKTGMAQLTVDNIFYTYGDGTPFEMHALHGVSLETRPGELLGLIGHTGSGKSTLIQHLNGLLLRNAERRLQIVCQRLPAHAETCFDHAHQQLFVLNGQRRLLAHIQTHKGTVHLGRRRKTFGRYYLHQ